MLLLKSFTKEISKPRVALNQEDLMITTFLVIWMAAHMQTITLKQRFRLDRQEIKFAHTELFSLKHL